MKLCVIIVLYNPGDNLYDLLKKLMESDVFIFLIDNTEKNILSIEEKENLRHIVLRKNVGIAEAQNIGIKLAKENNFDTIVFFDQDSLVTSNNILIELYKPIAERKTNISVPICKNVVEGFFYKIVKISRWGFRKSTIPAVGMPRFFTNNTISSGMMIRIETLDKIGGMDSSLFIDYVDTEWFLRAANQYHETALVVTTAVVEHYIGDAIIDLGIFKIPVHSPIRRYYRMRNAIRLLYYPHIPKLLAFREIIFSFIHQIIICLLNKNKIRYLYYWGVAIKDGISGKKGRIDE